MKRNKIFLHLNPDIHKTSSVVEHKINYKTRCEWSEKISDFNQSAPWISGEEICLDTSLFRGKGSLRSRQYPSSFPSRDPQYSQKESIIRVVGHFKETIDVNDLFFGGSFDQGVRGLPKEWILDIGIQIARRKSPHFCIRADKTQPFVAVPFITLADSVTVSSFEGRSALYWKNFDLNLPVEENWAASVSEETLKNYQMSRTASALTQRTHRKALCTPFIVNPDQLFAFELADSALNVENFVVTWKVANFIPIRLNLSHYISELPLSLFRVKRRRYKKKPATDEKKEELPTTQSGECLTCGKILKKTTSAIPLSLQRQGLQTCCFPPKSKNQACDFIFALHITQI